MVLGFFRHMAHQGLQYFATQAPPAPFFPPQQVHVPPHVNPSPLVPIFDPNGNITGYMQNTNLPMHPAPLALHAPPLQPGHQPFFGPPPPPRAHPVPSNPTTALYTRTADGRFLPHVPPTQNPSQGHPHQPVDMPPLPAAPSALPSNGQAAAAAPQPQSPADDAWDPWPDGDFEGDFTWQEFESTKQLQVHWSCRVGGGDRKGDDMAEHWEAGKKSTRTCQGMLTCDVDTCLVILRPQTTSQGISGQLLQRCKCNGKLIHRPCGVQSLIHKWSGGVHYSHLGRHNHPRLTHILHVSSKEKARFDDIVTAHPGTRALGLIVGVPGIHGPGESVADISSVYLNADRVRKERDKVKKGDVQGGDGFVAEFAKFTESHPDFVVYSQLGTVTVICMQTPFMASQLLKSEPIATGPVNGLVSDAAHGWWLVRTALLIVTSVYCRELCCWVPGIFSYTNGATAAHYECHFYALLESIAHQAGLRKVEVTDQLFVGIADFSEAERSGFRAAFIRFWTVRPGNTRTRDQLEEAFEAIYRGCTQHFRAGVTRVKKISGVVPPDQADAFEYRVLALLEAADSEQFQARAAAVIRDFPKTESWLRWWMRESHAVMLFASARKMDPEIWDSIPDSTNAEEAFHWKLYCAAGRLHALMEGLYSLFAVAEYYQRLYTGTIEGVPIRYGQAEPWKVISQQIGRTKPSRAPDSAGSKRKKNDGRPPDTSAELLGSSKSSKGSDKPKAKPSDGDVGYPWSHNSCWLDSALELLFNAVTRDFADFSSRFDDVNPDCALAAFFKIMHLRQTLPGSGGDTSDMLRLQRDGFRAHLKKCRLITSVKGFDSIISWLPGIAKHTTRDSSTRLAESYFYSQVVTVRSCSGDDGTAKHAQITRRASHKYVHVLHADQCKRFKQSIQAWLRNEIMVNKTPESSPTCWRTRDSTLYCSGVATNVSFYAALPAVLILEVNEVANNDWDFPLTLKIPSSNLGDPEIVYDIVGRGLYSRMKKHYIARYCDATQSAVFTYDSTSRGGQSIRERGGKGSIKTHLCGRDIEVPASFRTAIVIYHLRGGLAVQEGFEASQMTAAGRIHNIHLARNPLPSIVLRRPHFHEIDNEDRYWMKNPYELRITDYISGGATPASVTADETPTSPESVSNGTPPPPPAYESGDDAGLMDLLDPVSQDIDLGLDEEDDLNVPLSQTDSEFPFSCRCGAHGPDGALFTVEDPAVKCDRCQDWSHLSCQRDGRAFDNKSADPFECDTCLGVTPDLRIKGLDSDSDSTSPSKTRRKRISKRLEHHASQKPITDRIGPGKGVLVKNGKYWYPGRVIRLVPRSKPRSYAVKWWRGCTFHTSATFNPEEDISIVPESLITDHLWGNLKERRRIRLGRWTHACDIPSAEDLLADPASIPYNDEIAAALAPHQGTLRRLFLSHVGSTVSADFTEDDVPALVKMSDGGSMGRGGSYAGDLAIVDRVRVMNWLERHVANGDRSLRMIWIGEIPLAHAFTLLFAHRRYKSIIANNSCPPADSELEHQHFILEAAWAYQCLAAPGMWDGLDIEKECLDFLEERMFENSERAGMAGTGQWGLDAGVHQGHWYPYGGLPWDWSKEDAPGATEEDYKPGPDFADDTDNEKMVVDSDPPPARPRPRPKRKQRAEETAGAATEPPVSDPPPPPKKPRTRTRGKS
ncbi:hypothetical protein C8R47DRAFT_1322273 [Mycena vitilis]|nr:hypothetical protein C8R47DRAFT_1322273 [Mycena vitilis]